MIMTRPTIGYFHYILCNPPFVAVPKTRRNDATTLSPALYSAGGGADGMNLLRRILSDCFKFLIIDDDDPYSKSSMSCTMIPSLLMVTELPNVEESCELIQSFLDTSMKEKSCIRITYVEDDVESVHEYSKEREIEAGIYVNTRDWTREPESDGIRNRALVLLSISYYNSNGIGQESSKQIIPFRGLSISSSSCDDFDDCDSLNLNEADAEDAFLTQEGINFHRNFLLL